MSQLLSIYITLFFFVSCSTSKRDLFLPSHTNLYNALTAIEKSCTQSSRTPQFLIRISSATFPTPLQVEGVWKENFQILKMQILGPLGAPYLELFLQDQHFNVSYINEKMKDNNDVNVILDWVSSIGSNGIRKITCGDYALSENKDYEISGSGDQFLGTSLFQIKRTNFDVENHFVLTAFPSTERLQIKSDFFYGFWEQTPRFRMIWKAEIKKGTLIQQNMEFDLKDVTYHLDFLDYD